MPTNNLRKIPRRHATSFQRRRRVSTTLGKPGFLDADHNVLIKIAGPPMNVTVDATILSFTNLDAKNSVSKLLPITER